jgi:hypothetical protein
MGPAIGWEYLWPLFVICVVSLGIVVRQSQAVTGGDETAVVLRCWSDRSEGGLTISGPRSSRGPMVGWSGGRMVW